MRKLVSIFSAAALILTLAGCSGGSGGQQPAAESADGGVSGTFTAEAVGQGGESNPVKVTITLENGEITNVEAEGPGETAGIGTKAIEQLPGEIVAGNTLDVDAVSGATVTSNAILEAAEKALADAGLKPEDLAKKEVEKAAAEDSVRDVDVVVIGAGGAGLIAAITAHDAGKSVVILESTGMTGGNSVRSTGGMNAADTVYQDENEFKEGAGVEKTLEKAEAFSGTNADIVKELAATVKEQWDAYQAAPEGYFDSVELFELDTMLGGTGLNDFELVKTLAENSADAIDWLEENGAVLHNVAAFGGASVKRIHRPVDAEGKIISVGAYVLPILEKDVNDRNIEILFSTTAEKILTDGGKAVGVEAKGAQGEKVVVNAKAVVIASGGFGANNDMIKKLNPALDGYITTNAPGILGQGITMAEELGAATVDMEQIQLHPTVHVADDGSANLITEGLRADGAILVNQEGKRFYDEVSTRDKVSNAENEQTGGYAWLIVDQKMYDASNVIKGYVNKGWTVTGGSPEELAALMNIDPAVLAETISTWNSYVEKGEDPDFGRTSFANPLEDTLYALTVQPGVHHTMGGLKINPAAEVIDTSGNVIPGLFAAGEVTGGVHGSNRLGGNAVADFAVFGRIAGQSAADYAK
ncbi:MAG: flavocytochrome c [Solobacterium sp.]|nr:flavocytochrome c [Solobacterium sp.]